MKIVGENRHAETRGSLVVKGHGSTERDLDEAMTFFLLQSGTVNVIDALCGPGGRPMNCLISSSLCLATLRKPMGYIVAEDSPPLQGAFSILMAAEKTAGVSGTSHAAQHKETERDTELAKKMELAKTEGDVKVKAV